MLCKLYDGEVVPILLVAHSCRLSKLVTTLQRENSEYTQNLRANVILKNCALFKDMYCTKKLEFELVVATMLLVVLPNSRLV